MIARDRHCQRPEPSVLYHFCPDATTAAILASRVLWACDLRASKDPNELECGYELLRRVIPKSGLIAQMGPGIGAALKGLCIHVACLSSVLNVRSQWEAYADGGKGCAIGFKAGELHRSCGERIFHFPIVYDPDVQLASFRYLLGEAERCAWDKLWPASKKRCYDVVLMSLATLAHRSKYQSYSTENEWRLWVNCDDGFERVDRDICTRKLPICTSETVCDVVIGPDNPRELAEVYCLLGENGYREATVRRVTWNQLV